jgi:hypothetical protein
LIEYASVSIVGFFDFFRAFAILSNSGTTGSGSSLNGSAIIAALVVILTFKVETLKLNNEIVNIHELFSTGH